MSSSPYPNNVLPAPTVGDRKKRIKWSSTEDVVLISAWLNTSKDPLVGNEQKAAKFWKRIASYYCACPKVVGYLNREPGQCKQRWGKINEAVCKFVGCYDAAEKHIWIWHAFFGPPGTLNDINVLDRSPVFDDIINGQAPQVTFSVNGREYNLAYYLTDGIYPKWATFIQSIPIPQGPKATLFATHQESTRKDVERAFGVLQARFAIIKNPALFWDKIKIGKIMRACIILHNMIGEDEREHYTQFDVADFLPGEGNGSAQVELTFSTDMPTNIGNMMGVRTRIRDREAHHQLKTDLVENIWQKFRHH